MTKLIKSLLFEAYRRNDMIGAARRPLSTRWLGLGTAAAYRPVLNAALMRFHDGETPPRGCMGWLCLTEAGIAEMDKHEEEFRGILDRLKSSDDYRHSLVANYTLAGGFSAR